MLASGVRSTAMAKLFQPMEVGNIQLKHRVVMAPLTRLRASKAHVPGPLASEYYSQRASTSGTLLITEATYIAAQAGGYPNVPGIWRDDQISEWRKVTDAVHAKGSFIFLQLWALGWAANPDELAAQEPSRPYISSSATRHPERSVSPRALTIEEIREYVQLYATAASNAVHKAGFDGVEVHGANGYLVDQFIQDTCNQRTGEYGGSVKNRARFALEVLAAVSERVGQERTGIRLSPWSPFNGMRMTDPRPTFRYLVTQIRDHFPKLAYLHLIEPRISGADDRTNVAEDESNEFLRDIWAPRPLISAGGYDRATALQAAERAGGLIAFGRSFIANPDLPYRLEQDLPLAKGNRKTYYRYGDTTPTGYTDYPFASDDATIKGRL